MKTSLIKDPRFAKLQRTLGATVAETRGLLALLYDAVEERAGSIFITPREIEETAHWQGEEGKLADALIEAEWLHFDPDGFYLNGKQKTADGKSLSSYDKACFALLCDGDFLKLNSRSLAEKANISLGSAHYALKRLTREGFILELGDNKRKLVNVKGLFDQWVDYYKKTNDNLIGGRFSVLDTDFWRTLDTNEHDVLLGGEAAASVLTDYLKPQRITFYSDKLPIKIVQDFRLKRSKYGNVEFKKRFWGFQREGRLESRLSRLTILVKKGRLAPKILIYADLVKTGDPRCIETAEMIYDEYIKRHF